MADNFKVLATNVQQGNWLGRTIEYTSGPNKGKKVFLQGRQIRPGDSAGASEGGASYAGGFASSGGVTDFTQPVNSPLTQNLPNFQNALRFALDEAGKHRQAVLSGIAFSPGAGMGGIPGTAAGIVDMIKRNTGPRVENVFTGTLSALSEQAKLEQQERQMQLTVRGQNLDLLDSLAESGVLGDMPNAALVGLAGQAGLDGNLALAWKARIAEANKLSKEQAELEMMKIRAEIDETKANTQRLLRPPTSGGGSGSGAAGSAAAASVYSGIISQQLAEGATPEEAVIFATAMAEQSGVQIDLENQAAMLEEAKRLKASGVTTAGAGAGAEAPVAQGSVGSSLAQTALQVGGSIITSKINQETQRYSDATAPLRKVEEDVKQRAVDLALRGVLSGIGKFFGN